MKIRNITRDEGILRTGEFQKSCKEVVVGIFMLVAIMCVAEGIIITELPDREVVVNSSIPSEQQRIGIIHPADSGRAMSIGLHEQSHLMDCLNSGFAKEQLLLTLEMFEARALTGNLLTVPDISEEKETDNLLAIADRYKEYVERGTMLSPTDMAAEAVSPVPDVMAEPILPAPSVMAESGTAAAADLTLPSLAVAVEPIVSELAVAVEPIVSEPAVATDPTLTIPDTAEPITEETTSVEAEKFTYSGELGENYCPGSTLDMSGLVWKSGEEVLSEEVLEIGVFDTATAGSRELLVAYHDKYVRIPYGVTDYTVTFHGNGGTLTQTSANLWNYTLDDSAIELPVWTGREFTGWYRDAECTVPFVSAARGETCLDLYAGWEVRDPFVLDAAGYIVDYIGDIGMITDGVLNIPARADCVGIAEGAFSSLGAGVYEVYIPANICDIAPGAFDTLTELWYIAVHPGNAHYCSEYGTLYTKDMTEMIAAPQW